VASHPGDEEYKSIVQQSIIHVQENNEGAPQKVTFPEIPDQKMDVKSIKLSATSDAGLPVYYYVREGPAEIDGDMLRFSAIPPRASFPVKITVVAWQWGRPVDPKVQTAQRVERTFFIAKP
jgi:hypothetical protein